MVQSLHRCKCYLSIQGMIVLWLTMVDTRVEGRHKGRYMLGDKVVVIESFHWLVKHDKPAEFSIGTNTQVNQGKFHRSSSLAHHHTGPFRSSWGKCYCRSPRFESSCSDLCTRTSRDEQTQFFLYGSELLRPVLGFVETREMALKCSKETAHLLTRNIELVRAVIA
jgi:hypothetical protein